MAYPEVAPLDGLQRAVDGLAARLGRSVAVDDTHGRLVVASRHFGDEDPLRTHAVMQRSSDPRVIAHFAEHDIHRWRRPGRIPARPQLDFKARVCCPVRSHGIPFGHLFLIDEAVADWEVDLAAVVADEIGVLLHRRLVTRERDHGHREALARDLVGPDADVRAAAGRALLDEGLADALEPAVALAVHHAARPGDDAAETALRLAVERLARGRHGVRALATVLGRWGTLLLLGESASVETARVLAQRLVADLPDEQARTVVGLGPAAVGPDAARRAHDEARAAAEAAALLPGLGDVVEPEDLGAYAVLLALPRPVVTDELLPAALRRLVDQDLHGVLATTLEAYLDCCGDATRTAATLHVHRSTLYYRLGRIETIAGIDLHDGGHRLALHLGVKLRRVLDGYAG